MSQPSGITAQAGEDFTLTTPVGGTYTLETPATDDNSAEETPVETQRSFTPEDVNRIVQERLAKQKAQYGVAPSEFKKLRAEYDQLKQATQTESEKALAEAEKRGYDKARGEAAQYIAIAKVEAALTGVVENPSEIVSELNLSRYITEDGTVDEKAVKALRDRYLNLVGKKQAPRVGHGRTSPTVSADTPVDQFTDYMAQLFNR